LDPGRLLIGILPGRSQPFALPSITMMTLFTSDRVSTPLCGFILFAILFLSRRTLTICTSALCPEVNKTGFWAENFGWAGASFTQNPKMEKIIKTLIA
jgi:hypothetical protein